MENEEAVARLAKPQKKGILRLVFSRFFLILLLFALEIGLLIFGYVFFTEKFPDLISILRLFSLVKTLVKALWRW